MYFHSARNFQIFLLHFIEGINYDGCSSLPSALTNINCDVHTLLGDCILHLCYLLCTCSSSIIYS